MPTTFFARALSVMLALSLVLVGAGFATADTVESHYKTLTAAPALLKTASTGSESPNFTATPVSAQRTQGNPYVVARCTFSTASATAELACGLYHKNDNSDTYTFLGIAGVTTATASSIFRDSATGRYFTPDFSTVTYDTRGATHYDLRVINVSTGTVSIAPWSYGAKSVGTE